MDILRWFCKMLSYVFMLLFAITSTSGFGKIPVVLGGGKLTLHDQIIMLVPLVIAAIGIVLHVIGRERNSTTKAGATGDDHILKS